MKTKFILLTSLLLFSRGCDFYSTSLWFFQKNGIKDERNPLTYFFGLGWTGLIIINVLVIGIITGLLYCFCFRYKRPDNFNQEPENYKELASLQYFDKPNKFYQIFYKMPKNKKVVLAHTGFVMTITVIIASLLATIHNMCQFYNVTAYNHFRELVGRPLFVIYASILLTLILTYTTLLKSEFVKYKNIS